MGFIGAIVGGAAFEDEMASELDGGGCEGSTIPVRQSQTLCYMPSSDAMVEHGRSHNALISICAILEHHEEIVRSGEKERQVDGHEVP